jgi:triosephosphate isomerase (TIM)
VRCMRWLVKLSSPTLGCPIVHLTFLLTFLLTLLLTHLAPTVSFRPLNTPLLLQSSSAYTPTSPPPQTAAAMLTEVGCTWVILGHSERRAGFNGHAQELRKGESNETVATKTKLAVDAGLKVMVCVGEHKQERQDGVTMKIVGEQLAAVKSALSTADWANVSIAYEPCWAIGTGLAATPEMAQETHSEIRAWVAKNVSADVAAKVRIQYGGSMKAANAKALLSQPDIDGGLIGGASLKPEFFDCVNGVPGM